MAFGNFVDYAPVPDIPGAYSFQTANGKPLTFGGPEAEQLKANIDRSKSAMMVAGDNAAPGFDARAAAGELTGATSGPPLRPPGDAIPANAPTESIAALQNPRGRLGYGLSVTPDGRLQKYVPGTPGVTTAQLKKRDAGAVAQRTGMNEQVQAGTPQSEEYLAQRAALNDEQRLQSQTEGNLAVDAAAEESVIADQQFAAVQRQQAEEAARQASLQAKYDRETQLRDKAIADYSSSKVEPNRIFANPAALGLKALVAAGGAYAAVVSKTPNFAQQIIDQAISRDIAAQEADIRIKGDTKNTLIGQLRDTGMTLDQSRATAKAIQLQYYAAQNAAQRAKNNVPALQSHYDNVDLALQKSLMEANEQSRLASVDKVARSTSSAFAQPRAATAGGFVDVRDQIGTAKELQGLQKGEAEIAKMNRDTQKGPPASPEKRQAMSALADAANLESSLKGYEDDYVPPVTENRNIIGRKLEGAIDTVAGKGAGARATLNEADRRGIQDFANAQQTLSALQSVLGGQGALSGAERDAALAGLSPGATMGEVKRAVSMLRSRAENKLVAADATGEAGGTVVTK